MEFSGKTTEQAIETGLAELGLSREQAEIRILNEKGGIFKKARVEITKKLTDTEKAVDFIERLFEKMNIIAAIEVTETEDECLLVISTTETGTVIGKKGEVLDAVQYLASMYVNRDKEDFRRIVVDCENYRDKRKESLKKLAEKLAEKAIETGKRVQMDPMNPYERRIIHAELQNKEGVTTESRGIDPNRFVVIYPKVRKFQNNGKKPFNRERREFGSGSRGGFNRDRDGRGGSRDFRGSRDGQSGSGGRFQKDNRGGGFAARPPKKSGEINFGTFLGNVNDGKKPEEDKKDGE